MGGGAGHVHDRLGAESGQETTSPAIAIRVGGFSRQYVFLRIDAQMTEITCPPGLVQPCVWRQGPG